MEVEDAPIPEQIAIAIPIPETAVPVEEPTVEEPPVDELNSTSPPSPPTPISDTTATKKAKAFSSRKIESELKESAYHNKLTDAATNSNGQIDFLTMEFQSYRTSTNPCKLFSVVSVVVCAY